MKLLLEIDEKNIMIKTDKVTL